jgi:hypothetical protein
MPKMFLREGADRPFRMDILKTDLPRDEVPKKGGNYFLINMTKTCQKPNIFRRKKDTCLTKNVAGDSS